MEAGTPTITMTTDHPSLTNHHIDNLLPACSKDALFLRMNSVNKRSFRLLGPPDSVYLAHLVFHPPGSDDALQAPLLEMRASPSQPFTWETDIDLSTGSKLWQLIHPYISLSGEEGIQTDLQIYQAVPTSKVRTEGGREHERWPDQGHHGKLSTLIKRACYAMHITTHKNDKIRQYGRWIGRASSIRHLEGNMLQASERHLLSSNIFTSRERSLVQSVLILGAQIGQAPLAS